MYIYISLYICMYINNIYIIYIYNIYMYIYIYICIYIYIYIFEQARNQDFFRAGEFSWDSGTSTNIHL